MNILVIGSGGREHSIAKKFNSSRLVDQVWVSPGNPGMQDVAKIIELSSFEDIIEFVKKNNVEYVFVGPEQPLSEGIVDHLRKENIKVVGPTQKAAQIESSKVFAKKLMEKYNIPTAKYASFDDVVEAISYLENCDYPQVLKADGLAAGKGVVIAQTKEEAVKEAREMMTDGKFGIAGANLVIEEFMEGWEASIFAFCDGENFVSTIFSQDHKPAFDGDKGPNTGGMGAYAPVDMATPFKDIVDKKIIAPTLAAMKAEGASYTGVLYTGLMMTKDGPKVVEFNCRFGDPETEVILPLLETDLVEVCDGICSQKIENVKLSWKNAYALTVVAASGGYPSSYEKGKEIFIEEQEDQACIYFAGVRANEEKLLTSGGRVLMVTALGETLLEASKNSYDAIKRINFAGMFYRKDIGAKGL